MASRYELELIISSAKDLKNVNRRHGSLKPYVVVWVDPAAKLSTKVDNEGDTSPCWNETLLIPVPSRIEDSTLYLDVVHFKADDEDDTKPVVGSARLFLHDVVDDVGFGAQAVSTLELRRPSGRPHGKVEVKVSVRDPSYRAPESAYSTPCIDQVVKKEEADVVKVAVHGKSHVMPTKKLGRRECQLVTFDLPYLAFYYNQKLLFYKGCDFEDMVGKLKDGLAVVLEEFYQLAGKLEKDENGVFKVVYDDEMEGVEVLEASADHVSVSDLTDVESTSMMKDMLPHTQVLNFEGLHKPLLVLQVTIYLFSIQSGHMPLVQKEWFPNWTKFVVLGYSTASTVFLPWSAVHQAKRWTRNGMRVQPRCPRRYLHVALHELVGRNLQWSRLCLRPTVPRPHQRAQNAREVRPPPRPHSRQSKRHVGAAAASPRAHLPILGISNQPDQVHAQQNPIWLLQTLLHLPIALHARVARGDTRSPTQTWGRHRLHRLRQLPQEGRPSHAGVLLRQPDSSNLHRHRSRTPLRKPAGVRGGNDSKSDRNARRESHQQTQR